MAAQSYNNTRVHSVCGAQWQKLHQELKVVSYWTGTVFSLLFALVTALVPGTVYPAGDQPPHIVLVMSDDQGWGETGYYTHPVLSTPNLDAMAAAGLRPRQSSAAQAKGDPDDQRHRTDERQTPLGRGP